MGVVVVFYWFAMLCLCTDLRKLFCLGLTVLPWSYQLYYSTYLKMPQVLNITYPPFIKFLNKPLVLFYVFILFPCVFLGFSDFYTQVLHSVFLLFLLSR